MSLYPKEVSPATSRVTALLYLALYSSLIRFMSISARDTITLVSMSSYVPTPKTEYLIT